VQQEFLTVYGRAVIERDTLYLRSLYLPFERTAFAQIGIEVLWITAFVTRLFSLDTSMRMMLAIVWGMLVLSRTPVMYDKFFKRSYASRIPLSSIRQITTITDEHGIQTEVKLQLNNGRYKKIAFRNLENQLEPFLAVFASSQVMIETV
jgi:hypothetical protein